MVHAPVFPTPLHEQAAHVVQNYFMNLADIDTVLVVNSCARGQAVAESDLDFAILAGRGVSRKKIAEIESDWVAHAEDNSAIKDYKKSHKFAHLHLDVIDGNYTPTILEAGVASDYFEIEIGNHVAYAAPMGAPGSYFQGLQQRWLPYYNEELRSQRFAMCRDACQYDLDHIPLFVKRGLHFQAFDILCKAFQEYLQVLFIANRTYPIAYNKWIKYQVLNLLNLPGLYPKLPPILSVCNIESNEVNEKVAMLRELLDELSA